MVKSHSHHKMLSTSGRSDILHLSRTIPDLTAMIQQPTRNFPSECLDPTLMNHPGGTKQRPDTFDHNYIQLGTTQTTYCRPNNRHSHLFLLLLLLYARR